MKKTKEQQLSNPFVVALGAVFCCALWGSAFPLIKIGYRLYEIDSADTGAQILFAGIRFAFAGIFTILIGSLLERKFLLPQKGMGKPVFSLSMFQTFLQYFAFYVGLAHTSGVRASIIQGANVFLALGVSALIFHMEKMNGKKLIGCFFGFCGVVLVNLNKTQGESGMQLLGDGLILASTLAYAFSSVLMKRYSRQYPPVLLSGYQFLAGGILLVFLGLAMGGTIHGSGFSGILVLGYLSMLSAAAYSLWGILLKYNSISRVAVYGFMTPVFGFVFSALFLEEGTDALNVRCILALCLVCAGIFFVNTSEKIYNGEGIGTVTKKEI